MTKVVLLRIASEAGSSPASAKRRPRYGEDTLVLLIQPIKKQAMRANDGSSGRAGTGEIIAEG